MRPLGGFSIVQRVGRVAFALHRFPLDLANQAGRFSPPARRACASLPSLQLQFAQTQYTTGNYPIQNIWSECVDNTAAANLLFAYNGSTFLSVSNNGAMTVGNYVQFPASISGSPSTSTSYIAPNGGLQYGVPTAAVHSFVVNGFAKATISASGISTVMSGGTLQGAVPPTYTLANASASGTEHCVEGVVAGSTTTTSVSWNAAQAFAVAGQYSVTMNDGNTGTSETGFSTYATNSFVATAPATVSGHNYWVRVCGP